ncbi:MAG: hypothetical protein JWO20_1077 [Candidatus Angelobacter sp.]|jgi:hypothetical protein|nr:hypothetical protein [Candidatus Angelobacter sp.]
MIALLLSLVTIAGLHQSPVPNPLADGLLTKPSQIKGIPTYVSRELEKRQCLIPQITQDGFHETNIIHGEFAAKGQQDWAALCSKGEKTSVTVVWGGQKRCTSFLNEIDNEAPPYFHIISRLTPKEILHQQKQNEESTAIPINHDGIDDGWFEKGSLTYYCYQGKWHTVTGSD